MAAILAKVGDLEMQTLVDSVETTPVAADLFAPPAGYTLNTKQSLAKLRLPPITRDTRDGAPDPAGQGVSLAFANASLSSFLDLLRTSDTPVVTVELRPPRAELESAEGIDAWIDTYHAISSLARQNVRVMITDSAVGAQEENNLRHLVTNLGADAARARVVPFLTTKHSLEFCLGYSDQAVHHGFRSIVVLGGDKHVGRPRCVEHAWQLRQAIRARHPSLELGGWSNPSAEAGRQIDYLLEAADTTDFYLTQIASHHQAREIEGYLGEARRRGLNTPAVFGVFYYRSAKPSTLATLQRFLPVPVEELTSEFAAGASPVDVCARTIRTLRELGIRHFYVSNLPLRRTAHTLNAILERAGLLAAK